MQYLYSILCLLFLDNDINEIHYKFFSAHWCCCWSECNHSCVCGTLWGVITWWDNTCYHCMLFRDTVVLLALFMSTWRILLTKVYDWILNKSIYSDKNAGNTWKKYFDGNGNLWIINEMVLIAGWWWQKYIRCHQQKSLTIFFLLFWISGD